MTTRQQDLLTRGLCHMSTLAVMDMTRSRYGVKVQGSRAELFRAFDLMETYLRALELGDVEICLPCSCCVRDLEDKIRELPTI